MQFASFIHLINNYYYYENIYFFKCLRFQFSNKEQNNTNLMNNII